MQRAARPAQPQPTPIPREELQDTLVQAVAKLALQINGGVANAQATSDAFNGFQTVFNSYQDGFREVIRENEALRRENKALHDTVTQLKEKTAKKQ